MTIEEAFEKIMQYAHFWNWVPDLQVAKEVYRKFPNSYSILAPFAYSNLEELNTPHFINGYGTVLKIYLERKNKFVP